MMYVEVVSRPDGRLTAIISQPGGSIGVFETQTLLDLPSGANLWESAAAYLRLDDLNTAFENIAFSPDGKMFAVINDDHSGQTHRYSVHLWDTTTVRELEVLKNLPSDSRLTSLAFSPDSRLLAVGGCTRNLYEKCEEGAIWLIDMSNFTILSRLEGHSEDVNVLVFSPDGILLLSGSGNLHVYVPAYANTDNHVHVWGVPSK